MRCFGQEFVISPMFDVADLQNLACLPELHRWCRLLFWILDRLMILAYFSGGSSAGWEVVLRAESGISSIFGIGRLQNLVAFPIMNLNEYTL